MKKEVSTDGGAIRHPLDGSTPSMVDHPPHYTFGRFEVIDVLQDWFSAQPLLWQAVKYLARAEHKGRYLEDLQKARFYLERAISDAEAKEDKLG